MATVPRATRFDDGVLVSCHEHNWNGSVMGATGQTTSLFERLLADLVVAHSAAVDAARSGLATEVARLRAENVRLRSDSFTVLGHDAQSYASGHKDAGPQSRSTSVLEMSHLHGKVPQPLMESPRSNRALISASPRSPGGSNNLSAREAKSKLTSSLASPARSRNVGSAMSRMSPCFSESNVELITSAVDDMEDIFSSHISVQSVLFRSFRRSVAMLGTGSQSVQGFWRSRFNDSSDESNDGVEVVNSLVGDTFASDFMVRRRADVKLVWQPAGFVMQSALHLGWLCTPDKFRNKRKCCMSLSIVSTIVSSFLWAQHWRNLETGVSWLSAHSLSVLSMQMFLINQLVLLFAARGLRTKKGLYDAAKFLNLTMKPQHTFVAIVFWVLSILLAIPFILFLGENHAPKHVVLFGVAAMPIAIAYLGFLCSLAIVVAVSDCVKEDLYGIRRLLRSGQLQIAEQQYSEFLGRLRVVRPIYEPLASGFVALMIIELSLGLAGTMRFIHHVTHKQQEQHDRSTTSTSTFEPMHHGRDMYMIILGVTWALTVTKEIAIFFWVVWPAARISTKHDRVLMAMADIRFANDDRKRDQEERSLRSRMTIMSQHAGFRTFGNILTLRFVVKFIVFGTYIFQAIVMIF